MKQADGWRRWARASALMAMVGCSEPQYARLDRDASSGAPAPELDTTEETPGAIEASDASAEDRDARAEGSSEAGVAARDAGRADAQVPSSARDASAIDARAGGGDAGVTPGAASDASAPEQPTSALPAWTAPLPGDYAVEGFTFSEDLRVVVRWRLLWLAHIARVGDGYEAQLTLCDVTAASTGGTSSGASKIADSPPRRHRIDLGEGTFDIMPIDVATGYEERSPAICDGKLGMRVEKQPFQKWIEGPGCLCSVEAIPRFADDCRVTDPDLDGLPGITAEASALGSKFTMWGISAVRSGLVQGRVGADRKHTALYQVNETFQRFGCRDRTGTICNLQSAAVDCTADRHPVRFTPIDTGERPPSGWNCAALVERADRLFPDPPPPSPATCAAR